jgi:hypothetical protein
LRTFYLHYPRTHDQAARNFWWHKWNDQQKKEDEEIINILMTGFEHILGTWPFYLAETNELGQMRYHLTCLEKECFKSLSFKTFLPQPGRSRTPIVADQADGKRTRKNSAYIFPPVQLHHVIFEEIGEMASTSYVNVVIPVNISGLSQAFNTYWRRLH